MTHFDRITRKDAEDMGITLILETINGIRDGRVTVEDQDEEEALLTLSDVCFNLASKDNMRNEKRNVYSAWMFECLYLNCNPIPVYTTFYVDSSVLYREIECDEWDDVVEIACDVYTSDLGDW